jgi:predicted PurR-regulated permease PerM
MPEDPMRVRALSRRAFDVTITVRTMLVATVLVAAGWAFVVVRAAFLTLFLSLFAALVLDPLVTLAGRKLKLGRGVTATIIVLGILGLAIVFVGLLVAPFVDAVRHFVDALPSIVQEIRNSSLGSWIDQHSQAPEQSQANVQHIAQTIGAAAAGGVLGSTLSGFGAILATFTGIFLTLFLLIDMPRIVGAVDSLLEPVSSTRLQRIMPTIVAAISRTMLGNIVISIICGAIYGLAAWALGAPYPLALGLIAGFLDLIPMVGATVAGAILVLATLSQGVPAAVIMLVIVVVYQQLENYLLQPTILGKAADVSGFLVIASVLVFGTLLGAVGAIIAVPMVASIQIIARELTARRRAAMADLRAHVADTPGRTAVS